jgi:hypothetical protein
VYDDVIVIIFIDFSGPPPALTHSLTNERKRKKVKSDGLASDHCFQGRRHRFRSMRVHYTRRSKNFSFFFLCERKNKKQKKNGSLVDDDVHFVRDRDTKLLGCNEEQQGAKLITTAIFR